MLEGNKIRQMMPAPADIQAAYLMDDGVTIERWPVTGIVLIEDADGDLEIRYFDIGFEGIADFPEDSQNFIGYVYPNQHLTPDDASVQCTLRHMRARDAEVMSAQANI